MRPSFVAQCKAALEELAKDTKNGPAILMGTRSSAVSCTMRWPLLKRGKIEAYGFNHDLPNYGVFDEKQLRAGPPFHL